MTTPTASDEYPVLIGHSDDGSEIYYWCDETCDEDCTVDHRGEE